MAFKHYLSQKKVKIVSNTLIILMVSGKSVDIIALAKQYSNL